jgi:hypothetical protein
VRPCADIFCQEFSVRRGVAFEERIGSLAPFQLDGIGMFDRLPHAFAGKLASRWLVRRRAEQVDHSCTKKSAGSRSLSSFAQRAISGRQRQGMPLSFQFETALSLHPSRVATALVSPSDAMISAWVMGSLYVGGFQFRQST